MLACYRISTLLRYNDVKEELATMADDWRTPDVEALFEAILRLEDTAETEHFFRDLCTLTELRDMAQRWGVARLLDAGLHYAEISRRTGASTATITRIASWLNHGEGGYRAMLRKLDATSRAGTDPYPVAGDR
jgi:TrpR-related protein YerC/YecD